MSQFQYGRLSSTLWRKDRSWLATSLGYLLFWRQFWLLGSVVRLYVGESLGEYLHHKC